MWIIQSLFDFIFPPGCVLCKRKPHLLCDSCVRTLRRSVDTPYPWIYSHYSYRDPNVARILRAYKYYHKRALGEKLATYMVDDALLTLLKGYTTVLFVPIPMPYLRTLARGGNHAEMLSAIISRETGMPYTSKLLLRKRATPQQAKATTRTDREKSIRGAFVVSPRDTGEDMLHTTIVLVDDIITTGATLVEAKKTLERAGYKKVIAITLAH